MRKVIYEDLCRKFCSSNLKLKNSYYCLSYIIRVNYAPLAPLLNKINSARRGEAMQILLLFCDFLVSSFGNPCLPSPRDSHTGQPWQLCFD